MKKEWYIFINSGHIGPYSLIEMKAFYDKRDIKESTLIWKEGMKEWLPVKKVDLFAPLMDDVPPPLPAEVFNLPKKMEELLIPSLLQPAKEKIVLEAKVTLPPKAKSRLVLKIIMGIGLICILVAGIFIYQESLLPNLHIKGISPYNREQLENQLSIDDRNMSFALALSMDRANLWVASNQKENLSVTIDLTADNKRILGNENQKEILVRLQGMITHHLGHFTTMRILKGSSFYPGEYNVHIKGKKIHWINKYLKLNRHELDQPFSMDFKTLIYSGNLREFERKLAERRIDKINKSLKPLQDKMEALQTLKSLSKRSMDIFIEKLEHSKTGKDFASFEQSYINEISPIVQVIVVTADADLKKDDRNKIFNKALVDLGRQVGEEAVEMINKVTSLKKIDARAKKNFREYFQKKTTWIDSMIAVYLSQMDAQIKELQAQTHP